MISSTPDAAYEMCTEYCPPCDKPFKYKQRELSFVSTITQERLNNTTPSTKTKVKGIKKKKKKKLQALESQYTSVDNYGYVTPNYDDEFEEDDYDDEDQNQIYSGETDLLSVTRSPFFPNDVIIFFRSFILVEIFIKINF